MALCTWQCLSWVSIILACCLRMDQWEWKAINYFTSKLGHETPNPIYWWNSTFVSTLVWYINKKHALCLLSSRKRDYDVCCVVDAMSSYIWCSNKPQRHFINGQPASRSQISAGYLYRRFGTNEKENMTDSSFWWLESKMLISLLSPGKAPECWWPLDLVGISAKDGMPCSFKVSVFA